MNDDKLGVVAKVVGLGIVAGIFMAASSLYALAGMALWKYVFGG